MKQIVRARSFLKGFKRLNDQKQKAVISAIDLFIREPFHTSLNNHKLKGVLENHYAISAGYDLRVIYRYSEGKTIIIFIAVGKHDVVYK